VSSSEISSRLDLAWRTRKTVLEVPAVARFFTGDSPIFLLTIARVGSFGATARVLDLTPAEPLERL